IYLYINIILSEQALPNWFTGIIAIAVFLFLIFVVFLVNKAWCETPSEDPKAGILKSGPRDPLSSRHANQCLQDH
uniref:Uncharacterized protein n=1 Tax=Sinocyclocheilus grahami TaxID=75366 RepID=A0A672Q476_SINGR